MSSFTQPLVIRPVGSIWRTDRPLTYEVGAKGSGIAVTAPAGFETDLATIPRWAWWLFSPTAPEYAAASVLHDYLCKQPDFRRRTADALFDEALEVLGVEPWRRRVMYAAVRLHAWMRGIR